MYDVTLGIVSMSGVALIQSLAGAGWPVLLTTCPLRSGARICPLFTSCEISGAATFVGEAGASAASARSPVVTVVSTGTRAATELATGRGVSTCGTVFGHNPAVAHNTMNESIAMRGCHPDRA